MGKADTGSGDSLGPVTRAFHVLRVLAEAGEPVSVTAIAATLTLPTSTVHRLLQIMREQGVVEMDPASRRYQPGAEMLRLGALITARHRITDLSRPYLVRLNDAVDENCQLGILLRRDRAMMFAEQVQTRKALRFSTPMYVAQPLIWGCSGRVICAYLEAEEVNALLAEAEPSPVSQQPVPDFEDFMDDLDRIRRRGWDTTRGEKVADSVGFAAPVFDARGIAGSLSITIPVTRYRQEDEPGYVQPLTGAARDLSAALGHIPPDA
ncbi:IclR family transcriptional regulator [Streptomyces sp. NPDC001177]